MKTEALLFDLGGVLVAIDFDRVIRRWAELSGVAFEALKPCFDHGELYQRHERGEIGAAAYYESLRKSLGIELTDAQWEDGWNQVFGPEIAPTVALLPQLAERIPLYLFSNTNFTHHEYWSKHYVEALKPFRRQFASCEMGLRKPEAASFEYVAREIGVPPGKILFFDDTAANIEGARAVGLLAVHVENAADVRQTVIRL